MKGGNKNKNRLLPQKMLWGGSRAVQWTECMWPAMSTSAIISPWYWQPSWKTLEEKSIQYHGKLLLRAEWTTCSLNRKPQQVVAWHTLLLIPRRCKSSKFVLELSCFPKKLFWNCYHCLFTCGLSPYHLGYYLCLSLKDKNEFSFNTYLLPSPKYTAAFCIPSAVSTHTRNALDLFKSSEDLGVTGINYHIALPVIARFILIEARTSLWLSY